MAFFGGFTSAVFVAPAACIRCSRPHTHFACNHAKTFAVLRAPPHARARAIVILYADLGRVRLRARHFGALVRVYIKALLFYRDIYRRGRHADRDTTNKLLFPSFKQELKHDRRREVTVAILTIITFGFHGAVCLPPRELAQRASRMSATPCDELGHGRKRGKLPMPIGAAAFAAPRSALPPPGQYWLSFSPPLRTQTHTCFALVSSVACSPVVPRGCRPSCAFKCLCGTFLGCL
mmetsp:Transcript_14708/g.26336  ORF Transcript_14708/g.26336 Transcript_14708/m.26336 type:complete len:235 (-) Transcript_14708:27-731(-)